MSELLPENFFLRNAWTVAAWPEEITADKPLARTLLNEDVVLFRLPSGKAVALEDRCAHRLAPLSMGRIEADGIRCMYHGVKFDSVGACIDIPAQTKPNPTMCVKHFPLVEQEGFVWIWMGDESLVDVTKIVPAPWHSDPKWRASKGYLEVQAHLALVADNLLDFGHLPFVHANTVGAAAQADFATDVEPLPHGVHADRWYLDVPPSRFHQLVGKFAGNVDAWHCYDWHLPAILSLDSGSAPVGTNARGTPHGERSGAVEFHHVAVLTPKTDDSTHYFWIHWRNFALNDDRMDEQVHTNIMTAFKEDQTMVEAQHRALRRGHSTKPRAIGADKALNVVRFQVQRAVEREMDRFK